MSTGVPRSGTLHLTKECSEFTSEAGSFCTIASSNFDGIPIGSKIVYAEAAPADGGIDSDIVVHTPNGDTASGHVVLDGATQTGRMTLAGGTGQLADLAADLAVAPLCTIAFSNFDAIPIGSTIVYAEAATADGGMDSDFVVHTPNGDTTYGHVVLDGATQTGTMTLAGGAGQLVDLAADLAVAPLAEPTFSLDGPYSLGVMQLTSDGQGLAHHLVSIPLDRYKI